MMIDPGHRTGVALCLLSAVGFGCMAIFAKYAYRAGFDVVTLLSLRFLLAAAVFWAVVAVRRPRWPGRRIVLVALALGVIGYAAQAGLFFGAVQRIDASLASLLLYLYPALVFVLALALGHERPSRRRLGALACASGGAVLVLAGAGGGGAPADAVGIAMGLGAAVAYTGYILVADRSVGDADPLAVATLVCTGAAVTFAVAVAATGGPRLDVVAANGWLVLVAVALISTVLPVVAFLAGLRIVGASTSSILSTLEPVVTVALAVALFGEALSPVQGLGALAVLGAVIMLRPRRPDEAVGHAAAAAVPHTLPAPRTPAREAA